MINCFLRQIAANNVQFTADAVPPPPTISRLSRDHYEQHMTQQLIMFSADVRDKVLAAHSNLLDVLEDAPPQKVRTVAPKTRKKPKKHKPIIHDDNVCCCCKNNLRRAAKVATTAAAKIAEVKKDNKRDLNAALNQLQAVISEKPKDMTMIEYTYNRSEFVQYRTSSS